MGGPLAGLKVVELGGIGPGPFATMTLADMGAEVVRVDRPGASELFPGSPRQDLLNRGKRSVVLDLKAPAAVEAVLSMVERADVLVEGYRPGVAERLGLGPDRCWERNPKLVYGRMTGWGQTGPLAAAAGHDIDYIALTGALHAIGPAGGAPQIPLNLVGDFGGGGAYLVIGVLAALREADRSGKGQVVDAAIVDGAAHLLTAINGFIAADSWSEERGTNLLDGGAPFYSVYETSDGRHIAVGAMEAKFYAELVRLLGVDVAIEKQLDRSTWDGTRKTFADAFGARTLAHWSEVFNGTDACVTPVVSMREAAEHPHVAARGTIVRRNGVLQPAPAPRFSRTKSELGLEPPLPGEHTAEVLADWGVTDVDGLIASGAATKARASE
ncbi:MAG: CoA transferase [Hyphomicrobiales bacterium]|nr:MAG: CoA transferase [Hyphomicrobiales bacterium]